MRRNIEITADGSHTVSIPELNVTYHSHYGAVQESMHVFIEAGLRPILAAVPADTPIRILEIGFGTGLNALVSLKEAGEKKRLLQYISAEKYPLTTAEAAALNYGSLLQLQSAFLQLHTTPWEEPVTITSHFSLQKLLLNLPTPIPVAPVHCIFFDAFAPDVHPELWSETFFVQLHELLLPGGIFTTYSSKGSVRRALTAAGFIVEKIPGPPGKREMVRARKRPEENFM